MQLNVITLERNNLTDIAKCVEDLLEVIREGAFSPKRLIVVSTTEDDEIEVREFGYVTDHDSTIGILHRASIYLSTGKFRRAIGEK